MKITAFKYANVLGTERYTWTPKHINVHLAPNGSGKSTFLKALEFALTGKDETASFIRDGATSAATEIEVDGNTITRMKTASGTKVKVNGKATTQKSVVELLVSLGYNPEAMKFIASSELLGGKTSRELSDFFLKENLIPVSVDVDKVVSFCAPLSEEAEKELRNYFPCAPDLFGLDEINEADEYYRDARRTTKSDYSAKLALANRLNSIPVPKRTTADIDKELASLDKDYSKEIAAYNDAVSQKEKLEAKIKELTEKADAITAEPVDPAKLSSITNDINTSRTQLAEKEKLIAVLEANISQTEETLQNIGKNTCPVHKDIVCKTDKTPVKLKLAALLSETVIEKDRAVKESTELKEKIEKLEADKQAYAENEKLFNQKQMLLQQKKLCEESIPKIPPKPEVPAGGATAIAELKKRLSEERRQVILYDEALQAKKEADELCARVAVLEEIVGKLSTSSGIREAILALALKPLMEACNRVASSVKPGFKMRAVVNKGIDIQCDTNGLGYHSFEDLSAGEQIVAQLLMLDMLNELTGFRILVLDNLDGLDSKTFERMMEFITTPAFSERYDHIFLAAVDHPDTKDVVSKYVT